MLGHAARREHHHRVAAWLEQRSPGDANASLVARHYENAGALDRAVDAYARAGAHAASLGQHREALHSYEHACRIDAWLAGETDPPSTAVGWEELEQKSVLDWKERVRLELALGDTLRRMGRLDEALTSYQRADQRLAGDEASSIDRRRWSARINHRLAWVRVLQGELDEPRALVERAIDDAGASGLIEERAEMWALLAEFHRRAHDLERTRQAALLGLTVCREVRARGPSWHQAVSKLLVILGGAFFGEGKWVRAERCYLQASRLIDERDNPDQLSRALNNVASTRFVRGDLTGARQAFLRALALTDKSGDLWMTMTALANLGEVEHRLQNHAVAKSYLREAVRIGEQVRAEGDLADCHRNLAAVCFALGERERAFEEARRAIERARIGGAQRLYLGSVLDTLSHILGEMQPSAVSDAGVRRELEALARALDALVPEGDTADRLERVRDALAKLGAV
jgi:tetratricopeptide (TPR) repeat protein